MKSASEGDADPSASIVSMPSSSPWWRRRSSQMALALVLVVIFAGAGTYFLRGGHAANVTFTKTWKTASDWSMGSTLDNAVIKGDTVVLASQAAPVRVDSVSMPNPNLALAKTVVASSVESSSHLAAAAVDGKTTTRWASYLNAHGGKDPEWIYVDLGASQKINAVRLNWEVAYAKAYKLQVSSDAQHWTTVYSTTQGKGGVDTLNSLNASGRYVRMYGTARGTKWGYSLYELEVYAKDIASTQTAYPTSGTITLGFDADAGRNTTNAVAWTSAMPTATIPTGTSMQYLYASSSDNKAWSTYTSDITKLQKSRYLKVQIKLTTTKTTVTPALSAFTVTYIADSAAPAPATPSVTLSASPISIASGGSSTLTWSSKNATSCAAAGQWSGSKSTSGSLAMTALVQTSTYSLSCSGAGGTATASTTVTVSPVVSTSTSSGCSSGSVVAPCVGSATTAASGWGAPAFDDEFNGTKLNTVNWSTSWFNKGSMNNVTTDPANVSVANGNLVLTLSSASSGALVDTNHGDAATTGFSFGYGYAEARIAFPGSGSTIYNWPAWWTDGQSWPANGEADIAEGLGTLTSNYHSNSGASNSNTIPGTWSNSFHTFGLDREPGKNSIYWDGKLVRTYATDDNGAAQYLILNVGSSGNAVTGTASQVKVDYVRAWKK